MKLHDKTVARCGDGRLTSYSFSVKGRGWEVTNKPDSPSMKPVSVYGITFKPNSATSFDKVIDDDNEKTNQRVHKLGEMILTIFGEVEGAGGRAHG